MGYRFPAIGRGSPLIAPVAVVGVDGVAAQNVVAGFADDDDGVGSDQEEYWGLGVGAADAAVVRAAAVAHVVAVGESRGIERPLSSKGVSGRSDLCSAVNDGARCCSLLGWPILVVTRDGESRLALCSVPVGGAGFIHPAAVR